MPGFRRLGDLPLGYRRLRSLGSGQQPGFRWKQCATFENGALTPNPTSFDAVGGVGAANLSVIPGAALRDNLGVMLQFQTQIPDTGFFLNQTTKLTSRFNV